jgi:predicted PurR-regulated permease PerM
MGLNDRPGGRVAPRSDALTRVGRFFGVCVAGVVALWLLYKIRLVILVLITGLAIAYALTPLVKAFSGNRPHLRALGIGLAYLAVFVGLTSASVLGFRPVADDARLFATTLPESVRRADTWLAQRSAGLRHIVSPQLQTQREPQAGDILAGRVQSLATNVGLYVASLAALGQSFATLVAAGILALVVSAFILADPEYFRRQVFAVVPVAFRADAETLWGEIDLVLAAYVRGQIVIAAAVGLLATLAMALMRVKYAVILGLFTAVTQLVPQIGGAIGMIAAVALASLQGPALALGVLVLYTVLYQVSGNVLGPLVMGKAVQLHPFVILLATMVGTVLGGVVGLLLSVPAAAVLRVVWNFFYPRLAPRWGLAPLPVSAISAVLPDRDPDHTPRTRGGD